ncbi:MAG: hypothetical protein SVO26_06015 [Chloroflexota bacterium]|nr:hypothetical protein [Chloroflexota bacterium]
MPLQSPNQDLENERLAIKYRPLLVLYPEIGDGSQRREHHHPDYGFNQPPLDQDYHPRDIRFVLDHARLPGKKERPSRDHLLDMMSENRVSHIDIIDSGGPKEIDKFWLVYAGIHNKDGNPEYQKSAYVRIVRGSERFEDYLSIQYWFAYFFDDWANVHEMDWEMASVILKKTDSAEEPIACVFNAHIGGFRKPWKDVHKADDAGKKNPDGSHPIAYVANGSHATYFSDYPPAFSVAAPYLGPTLQQVIRITNISKAHMDYVPSFENGVTCFPEVKMIPRPDESGRWDGDWRWLNFRGKWGSPKQLSLMETIIARIPGLRKIHPLFQRPLREAGPTGPNAKGLCWENTFAWINLECFDAPTTCCWIGQLGGADINEL